VTQLDYHPEPSELRDESLSPWPTWPLVLRTSPAHAEGGARRYEVAVQRFLGAEDGNVRPPNHHAGGRLSRDPL
jgi:glutamate synthase (NADPH) small chain